MRLQHNQGGTLTRRQLSIPALVHTPNQAATTSSSFRLYPVALSCPNSLVLYLQARVERIAQAIAEEVKGQHSKENRYPREETDPRVDFQNHQPCFQVPAPARRGGLRPESQEAQRGLSD